jgi:hypothetical protein
VCSNTFYENSPTLPSLLQTLKKMESFLDQVMWGKFRHSKYYPEIIGSQGLWSVTYFYYLISTCFYAVTWKKKKTPGNLNLGYISNSNTFQKFGQTKPPCHSWLKGPAYGLPSQMTVVRTVTNNCTMFYSRNHSISFLVDWAEFETSFCYPLTSSGFAKHASLWWSLSRQEPLYPWGQSIASQQFK